MVRLAEIQHMGGASRPPKVPLPGSVCGKKRREEGVVKVGEALAAHRDHRGPSPTHRRCVGMRKEVDSIVVACGGDGGGRRRCRVVGVIEGVRGSRGNEEERGLVPLFYKDALPHFLVLSCSVNSTASLIS